MVQNYVLTDSSLCDKNFLYEVCAMPSDNNAQYLTLDSHQFV